MEADHHEAASQKNCLATDAEADHQKSLLDKKRAERFQVAALILNKAEAARLKARHLRASCDEASQVEVAALTLQQAEEADHCEVAILTLKNAEAALDHPRVPTPTLSRSTAAAAAMAR